MSDPTARILRLLSLLQTYRHWGGNELAERLDVSPRTLRRDVERLRELGYPVDTARGAQGGYRLAAGAKLPPLLLDDEEAVAIAVGLRTAAGGVAGIEEASLRALAKLQQVLPPRLRHRVNAVQDATVPTVFARSGPSVDADVLVAIAQACRGSEQLRFAYTGHDGTETSRLVEPYRLVSRGRRWYLVAWCLQRAAWRTFRVDRVTRPLANGVRFAPRELPAEDAAAYVAQNLRSVPNRPRALVRIAAPLEQARAAVWPGMGELEADGPERSRLHAIGDSVEWLAVGISMIAATSGLRLAVEGPPELAAALVRLGERAGELAATSGG
ncbi:helix-turn-helix transcriptional regulator [Motilibacter aurantiacus]|uniref:helix-turn-helix transcriptional regulator n=1 Tax=Motilibacter aurantiacus TaxID=2714955 RepID=UPI0014080545|nr:YafY family protein [Motilibacter aurantiacus]NHC45061.1 YafY family transcriptional regulator [Motilibacter aurantiacus]